MASESLEVNDTTILIAALKKENHQLKERNKHLQNVINESAVKQARLGTVVAGFSKSLKEAKEFLQKNLVTIEPIRKEKGLL